MDKLKHIFGPVPSRRLGVSLGVDLVPHKTCNLNCVYCECGLTTNHTNKRREYVKADKIKQELDFYFKERRELDFITFSGAGEPLLNSKIGEVATYIKNNFSGYQIALLTNGILLSEESIINEIKDIDLIIPSLDAASEDIFKKINKPHKDIIFKDYINGLTNLRKHFHNQIWLEVFFIKGINDSKDQISEINEIIKDINPDKIQINTVDRPPALENICPIDIEKAEQIREILGSRAEIVGNFRDKKIAANESIELLKNSLLRRPLTIDDIRSVTSMHTNEINKLLDILEKDGDIETFRSERGIFYKLRGN